MIPVLRSLLCLLALSFPCILSAQTLYFSDPVIVAEGSIYGNLRPRIVLDRSGDPVVLWGSTIGGRKGYTATWNGTGFNTPLRVNPAGTIAAYSVEGPNIAAHGDTLYAVYTTAPMSSGMIMLRHSTDGGVSWHPPMWVDSLGSDIPTFANVAVDLAGNPIVQYIHQNSSMGNPRYVIRRSADGGMSFGPEIETSTAAPGAEVCDCCTGMVYAPDSAEIVTIFRNNDSNTRDMWATRSLDGGLGFTQAIDLDSTDWIIPACPSSGPVSLIIADSIRTAFMSQGGDGLARVYLSLAHIDSASAIWNRHLPDSMTSGAEQNYPAIAGVQDTFAIAYMHNPGIGADIRLAWTTSGTEGIFQNPSANLTEGQAGNQTTPDIAFRDGVFHIVWANNATGDVIYRQAAFTPLVAVDNASQRVFSLSPHPVLHRASVGFGEILPLGSSLSLIDAQGRAVRQWEVSGLDGLQFSREGLPSGLYFLRLQVPGETPASQKLLLH